MTSTKKPVEIDAHQGLCAVAFAESGRFLVSGGDEAVQLWRVPDGREIATMPAIRIKCVAISNDGNWIAAGSDEGEVLAWETRTRQQVFTKRTGAMRGTVDVDFSPDSTRLVSADSDGNTATIWDVTRAKKVHTFSHDGWVLAAKYSPQGDQIATATLVSVQVWNSKYRRIHHIQVGLQPLHGLVFRDHLFVKTDDSKIKEVDPSTGSTISEWSVPHARPSRISLPQDGRRMAYSSNDTLSIWDVSTGTQLCRIPYNQGSMRSAEFSPGGLLAIASANGRIVINSETTVQQYVSEAPSNEAMQHEQEILKQTRPWRDTLAATSDVNPMLTRFKIYQLACERLESTNHLTDAVTCFHQMCNELGEGENGEQANWSRAFKSRCCDKLESLGGVAMGAKQYDEAILRYAAALSLNPVAPQGLLIKRSNACLRRGAPEDALSDAKEWTRLMLMTRSWKDTLSASGDFMLPRFTIYQLMCEHLESTNRLTDAVACFHQMCNELGEGGDGEQAHWSRAFKSRCYDKLESLGDVAMGAKRYDEAVLRYTVALSLNPVVPQGLLVKRSNARLGRGARKGALSDAKEWTRLMLMTRSWKDTLSAGGGFMLPSFTIYQLICERLETTDHAADAVTCFRQMCNELSEGKDDEQTKWTQDFKYRWCKKLQGLGDTAVSARKYDQAISYYSVALSLKPATQKDFLVKRSQAHAGKEEWKDALNDANEVITLDPWSPLGYERKYHALYGAGRYADAQDALDTMRKMVPEPSLPNVWPEETKITIRAIVRKAIYDSPSVLINAMTGRLCNKSEQAAAFESTPIFAEFVSTMTTHIDHARIEQEVEEFYRYATLSHTWEDKEPLYEQVIRVVVYELEAYPTHDKLQMFCKIVRQEGFNWAWSDTCCINKADHLVLQEALVSMFKWYEGSAMTIVFLFDVGKLAGPGALTRSKWNLRGWTLQEYHASKVVRIYTKDWTPYLGLTIGNHKESQEIISEMEEATSISAKALMSLCPGLGDIREKLRLASTRQTTRVEDAAYSLLGIFSMSLPVTYGEGDKALGRLLSQLLMSSGDTRILAWNGNSGTFNSCLPADIAVFSQSTTPHIPSAIADVEMGMITAKLRAFPLDLNLAIKLYDGLNRLSVPSFAGQRMKLPCLVFKIRVISTTQDGTDHVLHARATGLGDIEIKTKRALPQESLHLVHPWIDFLLDRRPVENPMEAKVKDNRRIGASYLPNADSPTPQNLFARLGSWFSGWLPPAPLTEKQLVALQLLARVTQPFGALLLTPNRSNIEEYKRLAAESLVTVQVKEITSETLRELIPNVRMLDVL